MKRTPLARRTPLKSDPVKVREWTEASRKPLPRMVRVKAVNPKRKARLRLVQFGDAYVAWLHTLPCVCCGRWERDKMHAHHVVSRARGGTERDLVSLHAECHERGHTGGWQTFQKRRGVDLRLEADRLWLRWLAFATAEKGPRNV